MSNDRYDNLRRRAEAYVAANGALTPPPIEATGLIEELGIYQAELTVQNEELRATQAQLGASRFKFVRLFDLAPVGYLTADRNGVIMDINLRCAEWLSVGRERILAGHVPLVSLVCPENHEALHTYLGRLFSSSEWGEPLEVLPSRVVEGERVLQVEGALLQEPESPALALLTFTDITRLRQNDRLLRNAKEAWERTFNTVPDKICIIDDQYTIQRVNRAFADHVGLSMEDCVGRRNYELIHQLETPPCDCPYALFLKDGQPHSGEICVGNPKRYVQVSITPLRDDQGHSVGCVHVSRDITEQKQNEWTLQNAVKTKELLLREVHHRVKNNLQSIIHLISRKCEQIDDFAVRGFLSELQEQARTISLVYDQLYQTDNIENVDMFRYMATLSQYVLQALCEGDSPTLHLDVGNIQLSVDCALPCGLIVNELLTNAVKYAFRKRSLKTGILDIQMKQIGSQIQLHVADNGDGMSPPTGDDDSFHTGLDMVRLWTTHQLGGTFGYHTEPNGGTRFDITFPFNSHAPLPPPAAP